MGVGLTNLHRVGRLGGGAFDPMGLGAGVWEVPLRHQRVHELGSSSLHLCWRVCEGGWYRRDNHLHGHNTGSHRITDNKALFPSGGMACCTIMSLKTSSRYGKPLFIC